MEFLSILLSSLIFIGSPVGFVLDQVAENAIRARVSAVDDLAVRVDNGSNVNLLQGKIDRLQVAARGLYPVPGLRIAIADLETDPVDLNIQRLRRGQVVLDRPLSGVLHLAIDQADLNAYLSSPQFAQRLNQLQISLGNAVQSREISRYEVTNPRVKFLADGRLQLELTLAETALGEGLDIVLQTGIAVERGHRLALADIQVTANDRAVPEQLIEAATATLGEQLSLRRLESSGLTARVLNFSLAEEQLSVTLWASVDPRVAP